MKVRPKRYVNIVGHKYVWFTISGVIILLALVALFTRGLNFGIDFTGGTEFEIQCKAGTTTEQVRGVMSSIDFGDAKIQKSEDESGENTFFIRTEELDEEQQVAVKDAFAEEDWFEEILYFRAVGPGWGSEVSRQAVIALIIFLVAILIYISIRFEFKMAICSIVALFHDVMVTVGVYALVGREVTPATVIAVLTILGYSLYDTIVIFDRIKENTDLLTRQSKKTYSQTVNDSLNQVLARSINTSLTTLIPIIAILLFGGETLTAFAFALFIGVIAGTYSSVFVASPLLALWKENEPQYRAYRERIERKKAREAKVAARGKKGKQVEGEKKAAGKKAPARAPAEKARKAPQKPEPRPKAQSGTSKPKVSPKERTKGPGSGKKKKKKKKKK